MLIPLKVFTVHQGTLAQRSRIVSLKGNFSQQTIYTSAVCLTGAPGTGTLCICVCVVWNIRMMCNWKEDGQESRIGWPGQLWNTLQSSQVLHVGHPVIRQTHSEVSACCGSNARMQKECISITKTWEVWAQSSVSFTESESNPSQQQNNNSVM